MDDDTTQLDTEVTPEAPAAEETPPDSNASLRQVLEQNYREAEGEPAAEPAAAAPAPAPAEGQAEAAAPAVDPDAIPERLKGRWGEKWTQVPSEVKAEFRQYESDIGRLANRYGQAAQAWDKVQQVLTPYLPMIQQEGGHPLGAMASLFETARILRQGTPDQKLALVNQMIDRFQIPVQRGEDGSLRVGQPTTDPAIINRLNSLEAQDLTSRAAMEHNVRTEVSRELDAFLSDPSNVYAREIPGYTDVMAGLLSAGLAKDLGDAYKQAAWKFEQSRKVEIAKITKADQQPRIQAATEARRAAVSVPGNSPGTPRRDASKMSVRETLSAAWDGELE